MLDEQRDWEVACYGFPRLFHFAEDEEKFLPQIDFASATIYGINSGISVTLYYNEKANGWLISTTSHSFIARCAKKVLRRTIRTREQRDMTDNDWNCFVEKLFWRIWNHCKYALPQDQGKFYMFRIVTRGVYTLQENPPEVSEEDIVLVGVRDKITLQEMSPAEFATRNQWPSAPEMKEFYSILKSSEGGRKKEEATAKNKGNNTEILKKVKEQCWELNVLDYQGVVICDKNFNRVVVHSPQYTVLSSLGPYTSR